MRDENRVVCSVEMLLDSMAVFFSLVVMSREQLLKWWDITSFPLFRVD